MRSPVDSKGRLITLLIGFPFGSNGCPVLIGRSVDLNLTLIKRTSC